MVDVTRRANRERFSLPRTFNQPIHEGSCLRMGGKVLLNAFAIDHAGRPIGHLAARVLERNDLQSIFGAVAHGIYFTDYFTKSVK